MAPALEGPTFCRVNPSADGLRGRVASVARIRGGRIPATLGSAQCAAEFVGWL